jgi:hypothetical protein
MEKIFNCLNLFDLKRLNNAKMLQAARLHQADAHRLCPPVRGKYLQLF